jgi:hypothetical protein
MTTKLLNKGDNYTHIVKNPRSPLYGKWVILEVIHEITYGYLLNNDIYILHNTNGPAFTTQIRTNFDPNVYALHGIILEKDEWIKKLREYKLKRILTIK